VGPVTFEAITRHQVITDQFAPGANADIAVWPWYGALAKGLLYGGGEFLSVQEYANVQRWTEMPRGGHFAALEEPQLLAEDIRAFFRELRQR